MVADLPLTDIAAVVRRFPSHRVIAAEHRLDSTTDSQSAPECNRLAKRVESAASFDAHFVEVRDDELLAHAVDAAAACTPQLLGDRCKLESGILQSRAQTVRRLRHLLRQLVERFRRLLGPQLLAHTLRYQFSVCSPCDQGVEGGQPLVRRFRLASRSLRENCLLALVGEPLYELLPVENRECLVGLGRHTRRVEQPAREPRQRVPEVRRGRGNQCSRVPTEIGEATPGRTQAFEESLRPRQRGGQLAFPAGWELGSRGPERRKVTAQPQNGHLVQVLGTRQIL
jgi:hypothetical protein